MAFLGKLGNIVRQSKKPSIYQAIRSMTFMPNSKHFIAGIPSQPEEQPFDLKGLLLGSRRNMNDAIHRHSFGGFGYGVRSYSAAAGVASIGSGTALANVAGGGILNLTLFWHINDGIREILADYVHHEMTRTVMLVYLRLFLIIAAKDVFVSLAF